MTELTMYHTCSDYDDTYEVYVEPTSKSGEPYYISVVGEPNIFSGVLKLTDILNELGIQFHVSAAIEDAINEPDALLCRCGDVVELEDAFINTCNRCGQDYNGSGQALADRGVWGEETGESYADIVGPTDGEDW